MKNYIQLLAKYYPGTQASTVGDPSIYTNIVWTSTSISQAELDAQYITYLKRVQHDAINDYRSVKIAAGYTDSNTITWSTTPTDIQNINAICTLIALGVVTTDQTWRDANNVNHTMTTADLVALAGGLSTFVAANYSTSWTHKANIDALTTEADILAYDYTTSWP